MAKSSSEIRNEFIRFFEERGHKFVPSSPLLPAEDPTLLFANAGMNQFKDFFLGLREPAHPRVANSQKCIRAGGKHNDLEDVGHDTYHHTFFEMLGNWSFGDYFKAEAIQWAWELLTKVWALPKDRLHVTVFEGDPADGLEADDEADQLWRELTDIQPSHIHKGSKKDNFWEMGDVGPCGPCSEIHMDLTTDRTGGALVNAGDPRVIELWNLVFIQYSRDEKGMLSALPDKHVDTGMGLERVCAVLGGRKSNYATDLFVPIIEKIETLTGHRYGTSSAKEDDDRFDTADMEETGDIACRVIADHARALIFAIADGVIPSNEGRGYVLRRILRRAARYGRQYLKIEGAFIIELIPVIVDLMGNAFGELKSRQDYIVETVRSEEESFGRTLDRGIELFQRQVDKLLKAGKKQLPGDVVFDLYATYGFPVDLTQIMADEVGMTVDMPGYDHAMAQHRELSGAGETLKAGVIANLPSCDDSAKYCCEPIEATIRGWVINEEYITKGRLSVGDEAAVVLDRTNFYCERGGQVGDAGVLEFNGGRFCIRDTVPAEECILHIGMLENGSLGIGQEVTITVDPSRFETMRNHTATHLLNWALREVLGEHINQAGSVVAPDRLRFDFSHNHALTDEDLKEVETLVNNRILADEPVVAKIMPMAEARKIPGVRAVFGEKYPDPVRVVTMGTADPLVEEGAGRLVEFCGGTHLSQTSQVGLFKILAEESVAKGVRRITAVTGAAAVEYVQRLDEVVRTASAALRVGPDELPSRISSMQKEIKKLRKAQRAGDGSGDEGFRRQACIKSPRGDILILQVDHTDAAAMRGLCDRQRQKGAAAIMVFGSEPEKVAVVAMVSEEAIDVGMINASEWAKVVAPILGGGGGGRPTLAQAGGSKPEKLSEAIEAATEWARRKDI